MGNVPSGRWLPFIGVVLVAWLAIFLVRAPAPQPAPGAPATAFSAHRALAAVAAVARQPHSIGTPAHDSVRAYLVQRCRALGLSVRVQDTTVVSGGPGPGTGARVQNVVARLPGRAPTGPAVLVLMHYDSQPHTLGASDDGSGVAAALETMRALRAGPPLAHDVVWVFTDGEEVGLLGAQAYAADTARLRRTVGVVLNFEARGNSGASTLFEVSNGNGWLVAEFAKAAPVPFGSSLAYELYKYIPNTTDFTAFRAAGLPGLNFAFSDGYAYYHSAADSPRHLDLASLQHQGDYMLPLVRHFASIPLGHAPTADSTFFNPLGSWLVHYPGRWNYALSMLGGLLLALAVGWARRQQRLRLRGLLGGALAWLGTLLLLLALSQVVTQLVASAYPQYGVFYDHAFYNVHDYHLALVALGLAVFGACYAGSRRWLRADSLVAGALLLVAGLQGLVLLKAPTSGFLLGFPLLFGVLSWLSSLWRPAQPAGAGVPAAARSLALPVLRWGLGLPAVALLAPVVYAVFTLAGLGPLVLGATLLLAILFGLLLPVLLPLCGGRPATGRGRWQLPVVGSLVAVAALAAGQGSSHPTAEHPQQAHLYYLLDADKAQAYWLSGNPRPDAWTRHVLAAHVFSPLPSLLPGLGQPVLHQAAPLLPLLAPTVTVLADSALPTGRRLRLRLRPQRPGVVSLRLNWLRRQLREVRVAGQRLAPAEGPAGAEYESLTFYAPGAEGVLLELATTDTRPLALLLTDRSLGLPATPRTQQVPSHIIPAPGYSSFTTQVAKHVSL